MSDDSKQSNITVKSMSEIQEALARSGLASTPKAANPAPESAPPQYDEIGAIEDGDVSSTQDADEPSGTTPSLKAQRGMSSRQLVLGYIYDHPGCVMKNIGPEIMLNSGYVWNLTNKLVKDGVVITDLGSFRSGARLYFFKHRSQILDSLTEALAKVESISPIKTKQHKPQQPISKIRRAAQLANLEKARAVRLANIYNKPAATVRGVRGPYRKHKTSVWKRLFG